ncbi:MAG: hypothetical protein JWN41_203, partial [Thermoleophilia bacterium]|nr:hypothetical protein [Thermoleophilia bacterium]
MTPIQPTVTGGQPGYTPAATPTASDAVYSGDGTVNANTYQ